jgi:hypothetical protein
MIVPTGVGAAIGGFAGDALPVARTVASVVDYLITHPNVRTFCLSGGIVYRFLGFRRYRFSETVLRDKRRQVTSKKP